MRTVSNPKMRNTLRFLIPFVCIPAVAILGGFVFDEKKHLFFSVLVALLSILLFLSGFEKKVTGSRRAVIVSVMIALCIVGRLIPFFKPVTAITVLAAIYLGRESGFTVGAFAALLSNFYFGQGPWTPFQMLAWGLIGYFAGVLAKPLEKSRIALLIYGVLSGVFYSTVMDLWTVLWTYHNVDPALYRAALITALPHTLLYAISNFVFLFLMAKPFGEKLARIKLKYGV